MTDDSQTDPVDTSEAAPAREASGTASSIRGLRIARALLAPVLVLGAVGVHFSLNVPDEKVVMPKKKKGANKRARKRGRAAVPERSAAELDKAWKRWSVEPYDGEPIKGKWGRRMQSSLNKAVVLARKEAFEGAPEDPRVVVSGTQCRTIRCRFILRSPYSHEPGLVVDSLKRQTYGGEPLWRFVEAEPTDPPKPHSPKDDTYLQVTVGISFDALDTGEIAFKGERRAVPEREAPTGDKADKKPLAPAGKPAVSPQKRP